MKKSWIQFIVFIMILGVAAGSLQNPYTSMYLSDLKEQATLNVNGSPLYDEIADAKESMDIPPINAVIDRVWKGIPGYNGLIIDAEASYEKMKGKAFDENLLVKKEVKPDVQLDDLEPTAVYKGNPKKPMVAFMINVAWGEEYLPDMLQQLKKHSVHATFFLDGSWAKKNPDIVRMLDEEGHEIGNHAYSHPDLKQLSDAAIRKELEDTNQVIEATIDKQPVVFAPPSGSYANNAVQIADQLGMQTVLWSVDTVDWKKPAPQVLTERVLQNVHAGALILMHPTEPTEQSLEALIRGVEKRGYQLGTVSQVLDSKRLEKR
ncbi:polysaccharide deacetylase family protein [Alkalihalobacillus hwajinpoensis]|uniref:polysaccharide deacetylase family protein n=1 Tax=Guptibacillus hwajinpoensis TaxID=208199 RepID=UPI0018845461|nr:polysaccharide deacetylase family protein [Pseudalkalibacillus hwajinpoensis]MBF0708462.1 polysaccharide deacetylase family protein [Pseudalkalibacillus hwajinpoensis]